MRHRLPPLRLLRLFEAAGRHKSFKLAAQELGVTPSAVSHGIHSLEKWLGVALFSRGPRGLSLSAAGREYLPYISDALSAIAVGTQRIPDRRDERQVRVSCAPTFAFRLLMPALQRFRQRHPTFTVSLDTSRERVIFPDPGVDLAIRMDQGPNPKLSATRILAEHLVPVCSPSYLRSLIRREGRPAFSRATLLHVTTVTEDWSTWLQAAGQGAAGLGPGMRFDKIYLALGAAVAGLGVAIGRRPLVHAELSSGALVQADDRVIGCATSYWLVGSGAARERPAVTAFRRWLIDEMSGVADSHSPANE
jgi:LysR family transcriptional regulator, glycine cleavage system transcriptional activator